MPDDTFDEGQHHWLEVDPNGDVIVYHPRSEYRIHPEFGCHPDMTQCPVHLHFAHRLVKHDGFDFAQRWDRSRNVVGAPHHTVHRVVSYGGDTAEVLHQPSTVHYTEPLGDGGEPYTFTLHEHGPEHGHDVVEVDGVEHVRYPTPWHGEDAGQQFERGQRAKS